MRTFRGKSAGYLAGICLSAAFIPLLFVPVINGKFLPVFLLCFSLAGAAYLTGSLQLERSPVAPGVLWGAAILARLILASTTPALSDDVYRYIWDGHLLHRGINPYAEVVNSPGLDGYTTPLREKVNHPEMASPYLPAAQAYFWLLEWIAPQQVKAYQAAALLLDLLTALVIQQLLGRLGLNPAAVILYLWNPLVMVEFAHSAHVDIIMLFLSMSAWLFFLARQKWRLVSVVVLALATLTKGLPAFFGFLWMRRWRVSGIVLYFVVIGVVMVPFAAHAGWGLGQVMDGRGLFGALRIYTQYWQFNSGPLYQLAGNLPGLHPETASLAARLTAGVLMLLVLAGSAAKAWHLNYNRVDKSVKSRQLIRLSTLPVGAYLLLSPTVHPWYVTMMIPLLPFFIPAADEQPHLWRWTTAWIYFSLAIVFSYLAYSPNGDGQVPNWVLWMEYLPVYAGLLWAYHSNRPIRNR